MRANRMPGSPSHRTPGELLAGRRLITPAQLDEAVALAERWSVRLGDALLARNWIEPRLYYDAYARNFDLPFVDLLDEPPDRALPAAGNLCSAPASTGARPSSSSSPRSSTSS